MIRRFSLYGFLKNQRYFEPFFLLVFLDKGLSFVEIGLLVSIREGAVIVMEVPSGALADMYGRRRSMILSFSAYCVSFLVFAAVDAFALLAVAMVLFGVGEAFRTGTHKAMIFSWLRAQGRQNERTKVYGYTRSWSKFGSALSSVLAAAFVFTSGDYSWVFYAALVPYVLSIVNFLGYPAEVEDTAGPRQHVVRHMWQTLTASLRLARLRRLYAESMGYEGIFHAVKDYVQPVILAGAVSVAAATAIGGSLSETRLTALAIVPVYVTLYLLSGFASRRAHLFVDRHDDEDHAAGTIWRLTFVVFATLGVVAYFDRPGWIVAAFIALHVLQNVWRPILISRFDTHGGSLPGATLLSVESQARRFGTMLFAPLVGWSVDAVTRGGWGGSFWPIGALGVVIAGAFVAATRRMDGPG
jgi:MFS family permease